VKWPVLRRPLAAVAIVVCSVFAMRAEAHGNSAAAHGNGPAAHGNGAADREVIVEWNRAVLANTPAAVGILSFRHQAMVHIAMFDAVNSIEGRYTPYHVRVGAHPSASPEAAAAQAAHDVLTHLIPDSKPTFDTLLANQLRKIPAARAAQGAAVGAKVARAIIHWRTADGAELPNPPYLPPALTGLWQPAAPGQVAAFVHFQYVEPFALLTPTQYLPAAFPPLDSPEYAADLNQVKQLGAVSSTTRTADQTLLAHLIAGVGYAPGPFGLWATVGQEVVRNRNLSLIDTARTFALLSVALNDGLQTSHTSKFAYQLWRPITAIRRAGEDMNDETVPDEAWTPLIATPPYPSHASNVACLSTSAAHTLARMFKTDAVPFQVTWTGTAGNPNVTRSYKGFSQLSEEAGLARVYGGIHFSFELDAANEACTKVADFLVDHYAKRIR
jgi:hypothetical protein